MTTTDILKTVTLELIKPGTTCKGCVFLNDTSEGPGCSADTFRTICSSLGVDCSCTGGSWRVATQPHSLRYFMFSYSYKSNVIGTGAIIYSSLQFPNQTVIYNELRDKHGISDAVITGWCEFKSKKDCKDFMGISCEIRP